MDSSTLKSSVTCTSALSHSCNSCPVPVEPRCLQTSCPRRDTMLLLLTFCVRLTASVVFFPGVNLLLTNAHFCPLTSAHKGASILAAASLHVPWVPDISTSLLVLHSSGILSLELHNSLLTNATSMLPYEKCWLSTTRISRLRLFIQSSLRNGFNLNVDL